MASKTSSSLALSLTLNLLLFVIANSCGTCTGPIPRTPKPGPSPNLPRPPSQNLPRPGPGQNLPRPGPGQNTPRPGPGPNTPQPGPSPNTPQPGPNPNNPQPGPNPNNPQPGPNPNTPQPGPNPNTPPGGGNCPRDALKLGVCADVLGLLNNVTIGAPPRLPCCSLLGNLVNLEAAVCLCTAIRANILGINLNVPIALSLVLNYCGVGVPPGFQC